jgi:GTP-binding protein HflX
METVNKTLFEIGAGDKPVLFVFNKIDLYKHEETFMEDETDKTSQQLLEESIVGKIQPPSVFISAKKNINIEKLKDNLFEQVKKLHTGKYPGTVPFY